MDRCHFDQQLALAASSIALKLIERDLVCELSDLSDRLA